jgi:Nickel responsive protein SCO4226-like
MKRYVIERDLPGVGSLDRAQLKGLAATSNSALAKLLGKVQWVQSFIADDKSFCIYLADSEASVREHSRLSGFPVSKITEARTVLDPMTEFS